MFIPEATSNLTAFEFDFEGYTLDLTGQEGRLGGDTINTIYTKHIPLLTLQDYLKQLIIKTVLFIC